MDYVACGVQIALSRCANRCDKSQSLAHFYTKITKNRKEFHCFVKSTQLVSTSPSVRSSTTQENTDRTNK